MQRFAWIKSWLTGTRPSDSLALTGSPAKAGAFMRHALLWKGPRLRGATWGPHQVLVIPAEEPGEPVPDVCACASAPFATPFSA